MRVAVLSVTRDRIEYTRHCFGTLQENAGCEFDHFVYDNASEDGTVEWLREQYGPTHLMVSYENIGICRALNRVLAVMGDYDVVVRFDNDCEVTQQGTLGVVARVAHRHRAIVAPRVLGLRHPPPGIGRVQLGRYVLEETTILGGIFMAIPGEAFWKHGYRFDESMPRYTGDEAIVPWWRRRGGVTGYLDGYTVNHYETSVGQEARYPEYHSRKLSEMGH